MSVELIKLSEVLDELREVTKKVELTEGTEEDLRMRVERILRERVWSKLGIPEPKYEYKVSASVYQGRIDALYGLTIFEYKKPGTLREDNKRREAVEKLVKVYIPGLLEENWVKNLIDSARSKGFSPMIVGIIFDGYGVVFVEYNVETGKYSVDPEVGFYDLHSERGVEYLRRIIRSVVATYRKKLDAKVLASDFGYLSSIAQTTVKTLYFKLANPKSEKTKKLYEEWLKTISQAYPVAGEELRKIATLYGFKPGDLESIDGAKLFYAIQTYYSLILKLLAAEVAARFYDSAALAYLRRLKEISTDSRALLEEFKRIENGFVYSDFGIRNFLEGELFSWYLDEWDEDVFNALRGIIEKLSEYDIEALTLNIRSTRDMFKLLYEELVPRKEVRQKLGIYTTPDWLAELILDELGLTVENFVKMVEKGVDPLDLRILDPGVGTGTFLSLVIQRFGEYLRRRYGSVTPKLANEALKKITKNVVGFDIDALAVLTARTNYLIALAATGLLEHKGGESIEIPIYMANSVVTAEELKVKKFVNIGDRVEPVEVVKVPTAAGDFLIPLRLVESNKTLQLLSKLREPLKNEYDVTHQRVRNVLSQYDLTDAERQLIKELYNNLLELKKKNIDDVWIPVIKMHLVPTLYKNSFDYVIGNPPWIAYRFITDPKYQEKIKELVKDKYGLVKDEHLMTHMEVATLFFVRAIDLYLKDGGLIGFVMPRAIFSADQHDAFRRGNASAVKYKFLKIIDCEGVTPLFYVPTCAILAKKGDKTDYPIEAVTVSGKLPEDRHKVMPLNEALERYLKKESGKKLYLNEIGSRSFLAYWKLDTRGKRSHYYNYFYQGATIVPQPCWFVDVICASHPDLVYVETSKRALLRAKVKNKIGPLPIERDFIYGVLTSAEVLPFCHLTPNIAVLPILPHGNGYQILKRQTANQLKYKKLADWLQKAEEIWDEVRGQKVKLDLYGRINYQNLLARQNPHAKYKVVYLRSGTYLAATVVENKPHELPLNLPDKNCSGTVELKGIIIESTLYWFETDDINEAYYLAAILNSHILDELIKPMQSKGQFGERDIHKKPLEFPIPKYNENNDVHRKLAVLGKEASEKVCNILPNLLKEYGYDKKLKEHGTLLPQEVGRLRSAIREEIKDILDQIDELVLQLFISSDNFTLPEQKADNRDSKSKSILDFFDKIA